MHSVISIFLYLFIDYSEQDKSGDLALTLATKNLTNGEYSPSYQTNSKDEEPNYRKKGIE